MAQAGLRPLALPSLDRAQVEASRRARALLAPSLSLAPLAAEASALLRRPVEVGSPVASAGSPGASAHRLGFELDAARLWIDAEPALVLRVAEALLGLPAGWVDPRRPAPPEAEAAWAALLVALGRRCGLSAPPRLVAAPPPPSALLLWMPVRLGGDLFSLRVVLEERPAPPPCFDLAALRSLGALPIALPLVAARGLASRDDLEALVPGAAWAPGDGWTCRPDRLDGLAILAAGPCETGLSVELRPGASGCSLTLRSLSTPIPWEAPMNESTDNEAMAQTLADAPVVVRVEVAAVTLEARQWASLAPGDVVATGVRVGEPVVLRANGAAFARGELCELDGEIVVRVVQRL